MYRLRGVTRRFRQGPVSLAAVLDLDLDVDAGEFVVIQGRSGSGKTTLLQLLGALDQQTSGTLAFEGRELRGLNDRQLTALRLHAFGFIFQQFNLIPTLNARDNVELALLPARLAAPARRERAMALLEQVSLSDRVNHLPSQLSGGEQQRVAIARALANRPRVLLADEPTGNLDSRTGEEIGGLLRDLWLNEGQTIVLVTHDRDVAALAPRVLVMYDGHLATDSCSGSPPEEVLTASGC
jgi:putative ABC transport system ATP-binding protein